MGEHQQNVAAGMEWSEDGYNSQCWTMFGCFSSAQFKRKNV